MSIDYSEKYVNKKQQEIQSAYFGHECFSIFPACCYFRLANGDLINENMAVISEAVIIHFYRFVRYRQYVCRLQKPILDQIELA